MPCGSSRRCFALSIWRYRALGEPLDLALLGTWLWLGITLGAYFVYLALGVTHDLWSQGIWFSENDVLHIELILWMIYIGLVVSKRVADVADSTSTLVNMEPAISAEHLTTK